MDQPHHVSDLIRQSGLFDAAWYLSEYPDVAPTGIDPLDHYLRYGARMHRRPGPTFDPQYYLAANPDIAASGVDPLIHYVMNGVNEGRAAVPVMADRGNYAERIEIVVPVFNALQDVKRCLESLKNRRDGFIMRVIVVNDGSDSATTMWLRQKCEQDSLFHLIEHDKNRGYTAAVNAGLRQTTAPYVIMLNSDTIVTRGWLKGLVRCIESNPKLGIVGPLSNAASWQNVPTLFDESGGFEINALAAGFTPDDMARVVASASSRAYPKLPFVNGFCFMMRRAVIAAIGFMDEENFPVGFGEENDYCIRAADAGFGLAIADDVYVFHAKSKSFGHEKRVELSRKGAEANCRKHGAARMRGLIEQSAKLSDMDALRVAVREALVTHEPCVQPADLWSMRVLFLLPAIAGGGGVHSIVQEASEMRRLGVKANIAVEHKQLDQFLELYADVPDTAGLFTGFEPKRVTELGKDYDVIVGTICSSMVLVKQIADAWPRILPAYYVQDYEPLFFTQGTAAWKTARASYSLIPNVVLFAKTRWIADKVRAEHGVRVHKVAPSIDLEIYRPRLGKHEKSETGSSESILQIAAMIRPQTPRRGAERTMRVLARLTAAYPGRIAVSLFGCAEEHSQFQALERGFAYRNHGVLNRREVAALLSTADLFLDLSDYQAFGRTALEAMACGAAAAVPVHGGADEYAVDGVNAVMLDSLDEEGCSERLIALIDDPVTLRRLQIAGMLTASRFNARSAALSELAVLAGARARHLQQVLHHPAGTVPAIQHCAKPALSLVPASAPELQRKLPITVLVITWDIGHNPLGRSYMLGEVLDRIVRNVVMAGFQFPRYGSDVWEPVRDGRLPVISLPGENLPELLESFERIAARIKPDLVIACKPRLPSIQLAAMIKRKAGCPVILDIDDHELSFFQDAKEITAAELQKMRDGSAKNQVEPYDALWTQLAQHMRKYADEIIVSNVALRRKFGGTVVPHVRDETVFDPALHDRAASRRKYGIPGDVKAVMFFGTPRQHKGINVLAEAVNQIGNAAFKLVIVGASTDRSVTAKLNKLAPGRIIYLPNQPFSAIPEIIACADVICLPQDEEHFISQYQLPAKAIDAVAMGIPLLVTRTPPLMQLVTDGVAVAIAIDDLPRALETAVDASAASRWAAQVRPKFLKHYSYAAAAESLRGVIMRAIKNNTKGRTDDLPALLDQQRRLLGLPRHAAKLKRPAGIDVAVFWKQNDSGIYGRRCDMLIRYLASRDDVRRVIVFDAPVSEHDMLARRNADSTTTHDRLLYVKTYEKLFGTLDSGKVSYRVFVYQPGVFRTTENGSVQPPLVDGYLQWLAAVFEEEDLNPEKSVFWLYPKNFMAPQIIERFAPRRVVVDVVDDHRAWPGVSSAERARLTANYRDTLARAHMAFVNCEPMADAMRNFFPAIRTVPNGCDRNPPEVRPRNNAEFDAFMATGGKVIGFIGNLEQKIDIPLVEKVAERFPECQVVLVGSTHANPEILRLKRYPNVRMPGIVPYDQIGAWLSRFDVGIIPHRDMEMTRAMNPLKLYVYLGWGVPVVSTEICNIDLSTRFVSLARSHDEFLDRIAGVLEEGRIDDPALHRYINENCWTARFERHVDELLSSMKRKSHAKRIHA
jgi:GT2 family glycosyltransferase/glycosyltransferase involved in cell wall biosynthesis